MANNQVTSNTLSTATSTDNNGSAVFGLGADENNAKNVAHGRTESVFASTVIDGDTADKAVSGGTFAFDNQRGVIRRVTTEVAGGVSAPAALQSAASDINRSKFHSIESQKYSNIGSGIRAGNWNVYSGVFDPALVATSGDFHNAEAGNAVIDEAVNVSRSNPGQLVYKTGAKVPVLDDYEAKNG